MLGEIWTYVATKPNDNMLKIRPILVIGNDSSNELKFVDIHYVIISSSVECGRYDVELNEEKAKKIGLNKRFVIKTTKIYTDSKSKLGNKIGDLPVDIKEEFIKKYKDYQNKLIEKLNN